MKLSGNKVFITGGSSGIGLELARQLLEKRNKVIVCGRSAKKLDKAKVELQDVITYQCDLSVQSQRQKLAEWITEQHPDCNVLFNNAAIVHKTNFRSDPDIITKADLEIQTNFLAPLALSKLLLSILEQNAYATIVNVTTGLVYAPRAKYPVYNATKAALHSFSQVLRLQLHANPVRIKEVLLPAVDTPWHDGNPPDIAISTEEAVQKMLKGLAAGSDEIRVGKVKLLYLLSRIAPSFALKKINRVD